MGAMQDLASLFLTPKEEPEPPPPSRPAEPAPLTRPDRQEEMPQPASSHETKLTEKLTQALEENNLEGIDFFEFRKTLDALVGVIGDEPTRYRAAFGSLAAQGAKGEHLVATADHYLKVLDTKETGFAQYLQDQERERVNAKLSEADAFQAQIREKSAQIARLTTEISKLTEQELGARNAATLAKGELEAYRASFQVIKARFVADIQAIREKIHQYVLSTPKA